MLALLLSAACIRVAGRHSCSNLGFEETITLQIHVGALIEHSTNNLKLIVHFI
jgi:hypothetical protein